ncbi:MAG TPA: chaperone modulator CbpM [Puia sp.]|nr:chaperone modulator CbpM [Puia sp.]
MQQEEFISVSSFCENYQIEPSFVFSLREYGLIEISTVEEKNMISLDKLQELEKFVHLHYDLEINTAGIDAITHLLERVKNLQEEIALLKNKLRIHE